MHLLRQQQLFALFFILLTQTISNPVRQTIRCSILHRNCTVITRNSSSGYVQRTNTWSTSSTSRSRSTTGTSTTSDFDAFSENLKRAALILAGIALGLGILRICLMLCKSRSRSNSFSTRHSAIVRPQVSTIEHHQFKPDLPPGYAEAIANMENEGGKLPTYEELPDEQRREQRGHTTNEYISTQM